jgi:hypothetical protein
MRIKHKLAVLSEHVIVPARDCYYVLLLVHCYLYLFCFRYLKKNTATSIKTTAALFLLSSLRHFLRILLSSISVSAAMHALVLSVHAPFNCF